MADKCNLTFPRKGKKICLTWIERNFKPKQLGTSDLEFLESPLFETEESVYRMRLIPHYIECPDRVACILMKVDPNTLPFLHYFVDAKIEIGNETWKLPAEIFCFDKSESIYVPLMKVSDLRDDSYFPPECKLTVKFGLRRCVSSRPCTRYASAISELVVSTASFVTDFKTSDSSQMREKLVVNESVRNVDAANVAAANVVAANVAAANVVEANVGNEMLQTGPPFEDRGLAMKFGRQEERRCVTAVFRTGGVSLLLKYELNLVDVRRNMIIYSKHGKKFFSGSENRLVRLPVPMNFLEEFKKFSTAFHELGVYSILSYHSEEDSIYTTESESGFSFCSDGKKYFTLKSDMENFYYNRFKRANFCIKLNEKIFPVHMDILSARSPVFEAMLKPDMVEKNTGVVNITEMDEQVLELFLKFIYSSELEKNIGLRNAAFLYVAADKYGILCLLPICRREVIKNISVTNFDKLLVLFQVLRDNEIVEFITSFLSTFPLNSEAFQRLNMIFDKQLDWEDMDFLESMKEMCITMFKNKAVCSKGLPQLKSCKFKM